MVFTDAPQMRRLLDQAEAAAQRVKTDVQFQHRDRAYVEYIACSEILLNIIPANKDFVALKSSRGDWQRQYRRIREVSALPLSYVAWGLTKVGK